MKMGELEAQLRRAIDALELFGDYNRRFGGNWETHQAEAQFEQDIAALRMKIKTGE